MENLESKREIKIETITPEDVEGMKNVFYKTWLDTYPNEEVGITVEDIEYRFKDYFTPESIEETKKKIENVTENDSFFVAKENNLVIGVCRAVQSENENRLRAIYVLPDFQGKGIGYKLWEKARETFDSEKPVYVALADYNDQARKFYEKLGFIDTGKRWVDEKLIMQSGNAITEMDMILKI